MTPNPNNHNDPTKIRMQLQGIEGFGKMTRNEQLKKLIEATGNVNPDIKITPEYVSAMTKGAGLKPRTLMERIRGSRVGNETFVTDYMAQQQALSSALQNPLYSTGSQGS